jgi:hypothetical protein
MAISRLHRTNSAVEAADTSLPALTGGLLCAIYMHNSSKASEGRISAHLPTLFLPSGLALLLPGPVEVGVCKFLTSLRPNCRPHGTYCRSKWQPLSFEETADEP